MKQIITASASEGAQEIAQAIIQLLHTKPTALLCLAAGHSSLPIFEVLIAAQQNGRVDFSQAQFVGLDEWLGVSTDCEGSCSNFLHRSLFDVLHIKPEQLCLFNPLCEDASAECARIESHIEACGGIDFMLLGMGMNGHLALNEPAKVFSGGAHKAPLSQTTLQVAPKYFANGEMPPLSQGITLGMENILAAKCIYLSVFGAHKQAALKTLLQGDITPQFPASALRAWKHAVLVADANACGTTI